MLSACHWQEAVLAAKQQAKEKAQAAKVVQIAQRISNLLGSPIVTLRDLMASATTDVRATYKFTSSESVIEQAKRCLNNATATLTGDPAAYEPDMAEAKQLHADLMGKIRTDRVQ